MSLLMGKRVWLSTGSSTITGGAGALAICGMARTLRAILSVTATRSCDSMPVPATKPCSSAVMCVTGMPEGFFTPLEAQPPTSPTAVRVEMEMVNLEIIGFMGWLIKLKG